MLRFFKIVQVTHLKVSISQSINFNDLFDLFMYRPSQSKEIIFLNFAKPN